MIIRIVKMTFRPEECVSFETLFNTVKNHIAAFDGCIHLALWRDTRDANVYFTNSEWQSAEHLEQYRNSSLFKDTWTQTKALFAEKAQAWSVEEKERVK